MPGSDKRNGPTPLVSLLAGGVAGGVEAAVTVSISFPRSLEKVLHPMSGPLQLDPNLAMSPTVLIFLCSLSLAFCASSPSFTSPP